MTLKTSAFMRASPEKKFPVLLGLSCEQLVSSIKLGQGRDSHLESFYIGDGLVRLLGMATLITKKHSRMGLNKHFVGL